MANRKYPFSQVDAFTQVPLLGNACAIILDADDLSYSEMLAIAREMNLSETAFVQQSSKADFKFRYFTPAEEIPLAGHPTIATVHRLLELKKFEPTKSLLKIELEAGIINVRIEQTDVGHRIVMQQLAPKFLKTYDSKEIMPLFGLSKDDILQNHRLQTVSTGTPMLMIPLKDRSALDRIRFDASKFAQFRETSDFFSAHLFVIDAGNTTARHFCPPPDVLEDPFTGSATGAMACYLKEYGILETSEFIAYQGSHLQRPGEAFVKVLSKDGGMIGVEVAGYAVTCLVGELSI